MLNFYYFYLENCQPCVAAKPIIEEAKKIGSYNKFQEIDLDGENTMIKKFGVYAAPTVIIEDTSTEETLFRSSSLEGIEDQLIPFLEEVQQDIADNGSTFNDNTDNNQEDGNQSSDNGYVWVALGLGILGIGYLFSKR